MFDLEGSTIGSTQTSSWLEALNNFVDFVLNLKWKHEVQSKHVASA